MTDDLLLFTVEADGRPIAVLAHTDLEEAWEAARQEAEEYELLGACAEGAELFVRAARDSERERWHAVVQRGLEEGVSEGGIAPDEGLEGYTVLLVPVSDPTDEDFDEEGNERA
jgi:hypothetical protein